jgi:hypothetical protein
MRLSTRLIEIISPFSAIASESQPTLIRVARQPLTTSKMLFCRKLSQVNL